MKTNLYTPEMSKYLHRVQKDPLSLLTSYYFIKETKGRSIALSPI